MVDAVVAAAAALSSIELKITSVFSRLILFSSDDKKSMYIVLALALHLALLSTLVPVLPASDKFVAAVEVVNNLLFRLLLLQQS